MANHVHGWHGTPTYQSWVEMHRRCRARGRQNSHLYSRRGIIVCQRWSQFVSFLADVGPRPSLAHTLDRIDGARGYELGNVRWATKATQSQNSRNVWLLDAITGERIGVREMARRLAMRPWRLYEHFAERRR